MLASCIDRAAIVQGTRTPPSHGGNPGSNPGSGTPKVPASGQVFSLSRPLTASPLGEWSAARWGAEHRVTGRRRPAHPISACRSGVWPGEGSSEACARPGCRRRSIRALCRGSNRRGDTSASAAEQGPASIEVPELEQEAFGDSAIPRRRGSVTFARIRCVISSATGDHLLAGGERTAVDLDRWRQRPEHRARAIDGTFHRATRSPRRSIA